MICQSCIESAEEQRVAMEPRAVREGLALVAHFDPFLAVAGRPYATGRTHNVASEHKWPDWVTPPVICGGCGQRVTLKQSFFQSYERGTFHVPACAPYVKAAA